MIPFPLLHFPKIKIKNLKTSQKSNLAKTSTLIPKTMKSRSHRIQPSDPPDEWISESWTVDCSCGVTFDDGEEMVSCDECGVWVHTRCFRFVKNKSSTFLCHNCDKSNEETEVAQLLVDLPNKTDTFPPLQYKNPVRMWAEAPLADRVHVQGVPGGDPGFFGKNSSIFGRQLWKCSGYVPKKFNIRYRDFECWEGEGENVERGEDENIESEGADVLFSLSKEVVMGPVVPCVELKEAEEKEEKVLFSGKLNSWVKKERNKTRSFWLGLSRKERSGRRKASNIGKVAAEFKKIGSTINSQMNMNSFSEDKALPVVELDAKKVDNTCVKREENKEYCLPQPKIGHQVEAHDIKPKHIFIIKPSKSGPGVEMQCHNNKLEMCANVETADATNGISSIVDPSNIAEKVDKGEGINNKVMHDLNRPKDESQMKGNLNKGSRPVILESENSKFAIGKLNVSSPNGAISACSDLLKHNMENNVPILEGPEDMQNNSICNTDDNSNSTNHLNMPETHPQKTTSLPSSAHKCVDPDVEDDANNQGCAGNTTEKKITSSEPKQDNQAEEETQLNSSKLNQAKDFRKSSLTSEKQTPISQKPRSATTTSITVKALDSSNDSRQHRLNKDSSLQKSRHLVKGYSKSSEKSSHSTKISHASVSKHVTSGSKDCTLGSSSKTSAHDKIEPSQMQNGTRGKSEKMNQHVSQSTSVSTYPTIRPTVATTLSDQELALLLHQQLNSSPRVPRVSRMLRASDVQLISQHASSGLSKRSSSSGGKEQNSRKKGREDASKDNSQESIDETKRSGRDRKYRDCSKKDSRYRSPDTAVSRRKSTPSRLNELDRSDALSTRFSPRNDSDDSVIATRTLPALIDDIMSKHNCSTYDELCDAVRPHWKNCRKPNGCRYAYPSHKHAVMDCLRNRSQWAYLIGREAKTNSTKRKRKDTSTAEESEKEEDAKSKSSSTSIEAEPKKRDPCHETDFPKGKKIALKRRGLELRNRRNKKRKHATNSGTSDSSSDSDDDDDKSNAASSEDENKENADHSEGEVHTSDSSSADDSR